MLTEADTCRKYVVPLLQQAGWEDEPHSIAEQRTFTDGRIVVSGSKIRRKPQKRSDYILRFRRDFALAVVEAKPTYRIPADGLQQAKEYADILGLPFAYATNGKGIVEHDFLTGREKELDRFPTPAELWARYLAHHRLSEQQSRQLLAPFHQLQNKQPRYYQELAVHRSRRSAGTNRQWPHRMEGCPGAVAQGDQGPRGRRSMSVFSESTVEDTALRDALLPKPLSPKPRVKDAGGFMEAQD